MNLKSKVVGLEKAVNRKYGGEEELIIHIRFVDAPNADPHEKYHGKDTVYPPVEKQIAEHRAKGEKTFIIFSNEDRKENRL